MNKSVSQNLLLAAALLALAWMVIFVVANLALSARQAGLVSWLGWHVAGPGLLVVATFAWAGYLFERAQQMRWWQRMAFNDGGWQRGLYVLMWLVLLLVAGYAFFMAALTSIFFDNFRLQNSEHAWVLILTGLTAAGAIFAMVFCLVRNGFSYLLVALAAGLAGLCFWAWRLPGAEGLIH